MTAVVALASASATVVLRRGERLQLPPPERTVQAADGRPPVTLRRISQEGELEVFLVEDLFDPEGLQRLLRLAEARGGFQPSLQKDYLTGELVQDRNRTSTSCGMLWPLLCPPAAERAELLRTGSMLREVEDELTLVTEISLRCARVIGVDAARVEPLQLVKYVPGQYYRPHHDAHAEPARQSSFAGEQRTHTLLVFVNDVPETDGGGHLHFPVLGLRILPRAGQGVLWNNLRAVNGRLEPDPDAVHEGEPPLAGEKVAMNVWVADSPFSREAILRWRSRGQAVPTDPATFLD